MERHKGYVPQNRGAEIVPLRTFTTFDTPIMVFPSGGKPFPALLGGWKKTSQDNNCAVQLQVYGGQVIYGGGTSACKLEDLKKFPQLEKKINAHVPEYKPKSYRYTEEAEARFFRKKLRSHSPSSSTKK